MINLSTAEGVVPVLTTKDFKFYNEFYNELEGQSAMYPFFNVTKM